MRKWLLIFLVLVWGSSPAWAVFEYCPFFFTTPQGTFVTVRQLSGSTYRVYCSARTDATVWSTVQILRGATNIGQTPETNKALQSVDVTLTEGEVLALLLWENNASPATSGARRTVFFIAGEYQAAPIGEVTVNVDDLGPIARAQLHTQRWLMALLVGMIFLCATLRAKFFDFSGR